jgi:hypothetical protein
MYGGEDAGGHLRADCKRFDFVQGGIQATIGWVPQLCPEREWRGSPVIAEVPHKKDPRSIRIELKISHEELSEMVGTTGRGSACLCSDFGTWG